MVAEAAVAGSSAQPLPLALPLPRDQVGHASPSSPPAAHQDLMRELKLVQELEREFDPSSRLGELLSEFSSAQGRMLSFSTKLHVSCFLLLYF